MRLPIAMWSGPRNISTAMMYAFANRPDCRVWDEPFYAWYLLETGLDHPMREQIVDDGEPSAEKVISQCSAQNDHLFYQKHMTHHMLPGLARNWIKTLNNIFLIRNPSRVLASYTQKRAEVSLADIGFVAQAEIFEQVADYLGEAPPVVDSDQFLQDPRRGIKKLCSALDISFMEEMLHWKAGPKPFDGIWASHWYNAVHQSTGFGPPRPEQPDLPERLQLIADSARPYYERLKQFAL